MIGKQIWRRNLTLACLAGALLATAGGFRPAAQAQVVLNEILADNENNSLQGGSDYVELLNRSATAANLGGMSLTDDPLAPRKYVIPAGRTLAAGGRLLILCTTNTLGAGLRSGFNLSANGESVRLYAADGVTILDQVQFGLQAPDLAIGRVPESGSAWVLNLPTPLAANEAQPLGATPQLCLNEWMAKPNSGDDWLEVYNRDSLPAALGGLVITDTPSGTPLNRAIPALSFIGGHGFVQFQASDLDKPDADHLDFKLSTTGETLSIYAANRATLIDRVVFGAQSDNISQGRAPDGSDNIISFPAGSDTPDEPNIPPITNVVISEVLTHTDPPLEDAVELHNPTASPVNIGYWWLSDSAASPRKYRIPFNTIIPAFGFKVFYEYQIGAGTNGFTFDSAGGDEVYLSMGNSLGNLTGPQTSVSFGPLVNGVSVGRHRTSVGVDFVPLSSRTFGVDNPATLTQFRQGSGRTNAPPLVGPVVVNEIHFQPVTDGSSGAEQEEFIELHNPLEIAVPLYHTDYPTNTWRLREGVSFNFPRNLSVPARGYLLVVDFDPANAQALAAFRSRYAVPADVPVVGPFDGKLSDTGEAVKLLLPDKPEPVGEPNAGFVPYQQAERIAYLSVPSWPGAGAAAGLSLQRLDPATYGNEPTNWFSAAPTAGRANTLTADRDLDGMPDDWEQQHGLNPDSAADAAEDLDGDHAANLDEYQAGTNPASAESVFRVTDIRAAPPLLTLRFQAAAQRAYQVQYRDAASDGPWLTLTNLAPVQADGEIELDVALPAANPAFVRIVIPTVP